MEQRRLLSISLAAGTLSLAGTDSAETMTVALHRTNPLYLTASDGILRQNFKRSLVQRLSIEALGGNDVVTLGSGFSLPAWINAGSGNDSVVGGDGADTIRGLSGKDTLWGGAGDDSIRGGIHPDSIVGGEGRDRLFGDEGDDNLSGEASGDRLYGGADNDWLSGGNQNDYLQGDAGLDTLNGDANDDQLFGLEDADVLTGGKGNDSLYGGNGGDRCYGGVGNDLFMLVGGGSTDQSWGQEGRDSFWVDSNESINDITTDERDLKTIHRVNSLIPFVNVAGQTTAISKEANGQNLPDPYFDEEAIDYTSAAAKPLFSSLGPLPDDVRQQQLGDCYFLAGLASIASTDSELIRQAVVALGDGTFLVRFWNKALPVYVRVDADLPTSDYFNPSYANFGLEDSIWVAIMEKAFCSYATLYRSDYTCYGNVAAGYASEGLQSLGATNAQEYGYWQFSGGEGMLEYLRYELSQGKSAVVGTEDNPNLLPPGMATQHAYSVIGIYDDYLGRPRILLRNPWGFDYYGDDAGYTWLNAEDAYDAILSVGVAKI